ncbi:MAG TPA: hypothetical protein VK601_00610 [Kofleriaceae bacterium]|nr:hypothetical protein [Kofleriaceae bacterium]
MTKPGDRSYKRSWKNLLINKRYQLRFTLFMVGLSALLMVGLGFWVMWVANETTAVSMTSVRGDACPRLPTIGPAGAADDDVPVQPPSMKLDESDGAPAPALAPPPGPGSGSGSPDDGHRRANVQIDESSMTLTATVPPDFADRITAHWTCELRQVATFDRLERGQLRILWAMIATGIALVLGLALYGIKMTHRVAGPLFKVSLYLSKMRDGRFDKVYNLRKGDQLVDFYDQFKHAHGGIVTMQRDDITRIAAVVAAAEAAGMSQHPVVAELRELLVRKEKSIE